MFKKRVLVLVVAIVTATVCAAGFAGCDDETATAEVYADLVAVRVNNFMADWENIDYNFTREGSSKLTVSVPYTNYLRIDDLVVSPGSEYKVYVDEGRTEEITDLDKIYVDEAKSLYIDVTNGTKSSSYALEVTVKQTNLPPASEIADKEYDNRGGHVYIPEDAETVEVDGVTYTVVRGGNFSLLNSNVIKFVDQNYIFAEDSICYRTDEVDYSSILNGNNYKARISFVTYSIFTDLKEGGVVKNLILTHQISGDQPRTRSGFSVIGGVCYSNRGTIENVKNGITYNVTGLAQQVDAVVMGFYAIENRGEIRNCLNAGSLWTEKAVKEGIYQMGSFVTEQYGTMYNCVNTGDVLHECDFKDDYSGAGAIAFKTGDSAVYKGVFNVGKCVNSMIEDKYIDQKLQGIAFRTQYPEMYPDLSRTRNYT